jgi:hypothetical protein
MRMFIYVFSMGGETPGPETHPDDLRVIEDRAEAIVYMKILGWTPRVLCLPV